MKKIVVLLLVLCLTLPQAAFAENETALPKWKFTDTSSHWAKKNISKMGLLQISQGYPDGTFKPEKEISQEEAIVMLIHMMGIQNQLDFGTEVVLPFEAASYAKPYIVLALGKKLITMEEEIKQLTDGALTNAWGSQPASREWITKLIVRALGKQSAADQAEGTDTGFTDDNRIGEGYTGYINVAKSLEIVTGLPDGGFDPAGTVTRASMAVFLGNAEKYLATRNAQIVSGTILSYDHTSLTLQTAAGSKTMFVASDAVFYEKSSNTALLPSDVEEGDYIYVIQYQNTAYYIEKIDVGVQFETITGVLENISQASQTINLMVNDVPQSYPFAANVSVTSAAGSGLSLSMLVPGSTVELRRVAGDSTADITSIVVKQSVDIKTVVGTIERILAGTNLVEVKETSSGTKALYEIVPGVEIMSGDRKLSGVADLYVGDEVSVSLKDGTVTAFEVTKSVIATIEGKVHMVDVGSQNIFLLGNNKLDGYFVEDGATVTITGMTSADLGDVQNGDEVILELNADSKVRKIIVKNRSIEAKLGLEFFDYDADSSGLVIKVNKELQIKKLSSATIVEYNGINVPLDKIKDYFAKGKKVDLIFSGERIVKMTYSQKYVGTVTEITPRTNTIKINADDYGSTSFTYTSVPFVEWFGKSSASLADIRLGDQVQLVLDTNQDKVQYIQVIQKQLYKVKEKLSYKLTVTDEKGTSYDINNVTAAAVSHYDKLFAGYNDIANGGYVMVSFTGSSPTSIYIPKVSYGVVGSVDTSRNTFTYTEFGKTARTVTNNTSVVLNAAAQSSITGLNADDRVHLVEGKDGVRWITVLAKQAKTFVSYSTTGKTIDFTRVTMTENNRFTLHDSAYIHKGTQVIDPVTLVRNDKLNVYFHDGKIVELEKQ